MAGKRYFLLGISGCTNSGKTTLSAKLHAALSNSKMICQDDYFVEPDHPGVPVTEDGFQNWDVFEVLDMKRMMRDVKKWIQAQNEQSSSLPVLIIEGFLIFNYLPLAKMFDKKFFITVDKETCEERRKTRVYNPPDPPGYFNAVAWPMYLKHLDEIKDQLDIEYMDSSSDLDTMAEKMLKEVKALMRSCSTPPVLENGHI